ncbi:hypothetical protein ACFQRB_14530 [Halobaculum litoreum]|uniref:Uncharacterized protein n=1 Tax=Halobaculum litoreum TaxID=3031998 RepID=A0ABD5XV38_9EURY
MSSLVRPAHLRPAESSVPAVVAFVVGLLVHGAYEVVAVRAGPVPIVVTAPVVATLAYLRFAPASRLRIAALLGWGRSRRSRASSGCTC